MILSKLLSLLGLWKHEIAQLLILVAAVFAFKYFSDPPKTITITKVETKIEKVIEVQEKIVYRDVEKIVYRDRVVTKTVTKPSGVVIQTVTVDHGTTQYVEKELQVEEVTKQVDKEQVFVSEHKTEPSKLSRYSLALDYGLDAINKFDVSRLGAEAGLRIVSLPLWLTARVEDVGKVWKVGLRMEFN